MAVCCCVWKSSVRVPLLPEFSFLIYQPWEADAGNGRGSSWAQEMRMGTPGGPYRWECGFSETFISTDVFLETLRPGRKFCLELDQTWGDTDSSPSTAERELLLIFHHR